MPDQKPIIITPGEPTGIGIDIIITAVYKNKLNYPYLIIADPDLLIQRANQLGIKNWQCDYIMPVNYYYRGNYKNINKSYVLDCLDRAIQLCLEKKAAALLTGPVNKAIINQQNKKINFIGHTHYLAEKTNTSQVLMFFETPQLKLALVTDHLPLSKVPENITSDRIKFVIECLYDYCRQYLTISKPHIAVCGLNPHAGESGYLGQEENLIITPVIKFFQKKNWNITGPFSADSLFYENNLKKYDAVIAMYHDQGLSVLKHRYFGQAVNITLGLPFLRTSVDHGTACELAGTGKADDSSFIYAFKKTVSLISKYQK